MLRTFASHMPRLAAGALVTTVALCGIAQAESTVKVGYLIPLSGTSAASIGQEMSRGTRLAVDHINQAGGIDSLDGAALELLEVDTRGDARVGSTEAERLITSEDVSVLLGAYQSSVTLPSTAVAERYEIPWIVDLAAAEAITERGFRYVFRPTQVPSSANAEGSVNFVKWAAENLDPEPKSVAIIYENTDWGQDMAKTLREGFADSGLDIVMDESYAPNSSNLRPLVLKLKGTDPDIVSVTAYTGDAIQIQRLMTQLRIDPMAVIGSAAGHADRSFIPTVGERDTHGVFTTNGWAGYDATVTTPFAQRFWDEYVAEYDAVPTEFGVSAYAAVWVLKDALERAGSDDPDAIRDALAETDMRDNDVTGLTGYRIAFDETNQNTHKGFVMQQIQNGQYSTVWPAHLKPEDVEIVWPAAGWITP